MLGDMWKFTMTAREALMSARKWLSGKEASDISIAFDELREGVRRGDKKAVKAMVWLAFCVGKERESELDELVEAKAMKFISEFATSKACPREVRMEIGAEIERYEQGYRKLGVAAESILNTLMIIQREESEYELFREPEKGQRLKV